MYGSELWTLNSNNVKNLCVAWRMALGRILCLPYTSHSYLLPIMSDTFPKFEEICKRSVRFIANCIDSSSQLVKSVT